VVDQKFRILSLDGGGVRGYLSIKILENVEIFLNEVNGNDLPIGNRFDLIVGTSTGAIIGGLLAIGKTAKEVRKLYENDISIIFGKEMMRGRIMRLFRPKYKSDILEKRARSYFEERTFKDVTTDLIITSVDITTMTPRFHKSDFSKKI
jgi:patatin-like phospholipase/acyl hydrolase